MRKIQLLTIVTILTALGAGAAVKSYSSASLPAAPQQALPIPQPASTAHSATMPIIVPAEAINPTAEYYDTWLRP